MGNKHRVGKMHTEETKRKQSIAQQGELSSSAKLTDEKVRNIKMLLSTGNYSQSEIARMFGVSQITICNIHTGNTWKHIK